MTFEKRCTIEPSDILALIYECGACGASTRIPIGKLASGTFAGLLTRDCSQCGHPTGVGQHTGEYEQLLSFSESARNLAKTAQGRNLKLKMEVKCVDVEQKP